MRLTVPPSGIITLLTDFGLEDSYVAEVKGVILSLAPEATLVDVTHLVPPQDVVRGALVLAGAFQRFPQGTVHLAVVDPGVGTSRRGLAVEAGGHLFVGPDNGLLSLALDRLGAFSQAETTPAAYPPRSPAPRSLSQGAQAIHLTEPRFWLPSVSATFHGRDVFAPVAAHLARGVLLGELGTPLMSLVALPLRRPRRLANGRVLGQVVAVDRFGTLMTNIRAEDASNQDVEIEVAGRRIQGLRRTYGAGSDGELIALVNSGEYIELAVVNGNAAEALGVGGGAEVILQSLT